MTLTEYRVAAKPEPYENTPILWPAKCEGVCLQHTNILFTDAAQHQFTHSLHSVTEDWRQKPAQSSTLQLLQQRTNLLIFSAQMHWKTDQVLQISSDNLLDLLERVLWCWWTRGGPTVQLMKPGSHRQMACTCFHSGWKWAASSWSSSQTDPSWLSWRPSPHPGQSTSPLAAHPYNSRRKLSQPMITEPQLS